MALTIRSDDNVCAAEDLSCQLLVLWFDQQYWFGSIQVVAIALALDTKHVNFHIPLVFYASLNAPLGRNHTK